ncbi:hypothetical protein RhiirA4_452931 [Rhizophagus irregularis]|uniref:Uncharacterized protein n=1 Tax=Rhizophagus irregularis TaxID=588596 RepID=A0A2I1FZA1_9GLOM|nr:hypothetical protein RhiirA4_452931 [Rhizophagus irregularis]
MTKPITILTKVLIAKHDSIFPDYILLGNDWFYGRNNDGNQVYLAEIVTDAEDVWLRATLCIKELLSRNEVIQAIPIYTSQDVSALETAIQEQLGEPFNNKSLDIQQVHPGSVPEKMKKAGMKPASSSSSDSDSNSDSNSDYDESMERIHDELTRKEVEAFEAAKSKWADIKIFDDESDEEESKNETPQITNEEIFAALGIFEE